MSTYEFFGEKLELAEKIPQFALFEFGEAAAAEQEAESDSPEGFASMMRLVIGCLAPNEEKRFRTIARKNQAGFDDLFAIVKATVAQEAERPTGRSADSSDGPESTPPKSESSADAKASLYPGRPDLQLLLSQTA